MPLTGLPIPMDWRSTMPVITAALSAGGSSRPQVSDIHFHQNGEPWFRQGAVLVPMGHLGKVSSRELENVFAWIGQCPRVDWLAGNNATTTVSDMEGRRWQATGYNEIDGLSAAFRRLQESIPPLEQLGLPVEVRRLAAQSSGLILAAGPARSGRSTTLASLVELINQTRQSHILIIEHPVEYLHKSKLSLVSHRDVDAQERSTVLATTLHSNSDVVLIGDIRTTKDIQLCLALSAAGHLVFTSVHALDSAGACERMAAAVGINGQMLLSQVLRGVIAQRRIPDASDPRGCYVAAEVLMMTSTLRALLKPGGDIDGIRAYLLNKKASIDDALVAKCLRGEITEETARSECVDTEVFDSLLHRVTFQKQTV